MKIYYNFLLKLMDRYIQIISVSSQSHNYGKKIIIEKPKINKKPLIELPGVNYYHLYILGII